MKKERKTERGSSQPPAIQEHFMHTLSDRFKFDTYKGGLFIKTISNKILLDLKIVREEQDNKQMLVFENFKQKYWLFGTEKSEDLISFYLKPIVNTVSKEEPILILYLLENEVSYQFKKESELEPAF